MYECIVSFATLTVARFVYKRNATYLKHQFFQVHKRWLK